MCGYDAWNLRQVGSGLLEDDLEQRGSEAQLGDLGGTILWAVTLRQSSVAR